MYLRWTLVSTLCDNTVVLWYLPVDQVSNDGSCAETTEDSQRECSRRESQTNSADEHHSLESFSEYGDEGQQEHCVLLAPQLEAVPGSIFVCHFLLLQSLSQFDAPFILELRDPEQCSSNEGDDDGSEQTEDAFPYAFSPCEGILIQAIEGADHAGSNDDADEQSKSRTKPDLPA